MSINLIRFESADGPRWAVLRDGLAVPLPAEYVSTADVLADRAKTARTVLADTAIAGIRIDGLRLLAPVPDARILCQGANYRSHMIESGMNPDRAFNMLFTKSTASLTGPDGEIVRPGHVRLLDYEVELGIVLGVPITGPVTVTDDDLHAYIGAFVLANDVSARDVQLPQGQWYKGKSYPTFCPAGPYLCVPDPGEVRRWRELRLTLSVNGKVRQDGLAGDMVFGPAATLTELSGLERLGTGDLILTGTPGGCALQPPGAAAQRIAGLLPEEKRWDLFVKTQSRSSAYLQPGDLVEASIRTADGRLDLGVQRHRVH
ncbi:fumarylacetoacetate hydrolase family protein [Actinoplanes teichomyceticus]|uniref:2-keto-4-pentenoate hydratase/2-oxohepta-3-ene-1,7-dioic acid hydratase in catechol pathway n=1 Tax=Actinoplanes teichomyceticus TaxID=1867 RepID=A0A561VLE7_ACTTI|nr:fumarylacetoacetate hydrolase family protein [Actinoplanes teichomyceticus]TWG12439.1 2-keto-4-pentenoate hydratase/2-oxohepta-3-ene-1,7-dioic acid hydratase in catechol pathway [Actinoplanes teichomyceticus]GIF13800.1 fumarylacetoacetate hydrolase [Actinoplanes teichomyceticus]